MMWDGALSSRNHYLMMTINSRDGVCRIANSQRPRRPPPLPSMVLLHLKRSEKESFLYEVAAASEVEQVRTDLVRIHNLRHKALRLVTAVEQLALYGPMKLPEQQGLDDATPLLEDYDVSSGTTQPRTVQHGANYRQDPTEKRTGDAPSDELAAVLNRTVEDAKALVSQRMVEMKKPITAKALEDSLNNIRGAVMIVYPMGLPDYDDVRRILEEREELEGASVRLGPHAWHGVCALNNQPWRTPLRHI